MKNLIITDENLTEAQKMDLQIAFENREKSNDWNLDPKKYSKFANNIEEVRTHIQLERMFDYSIPLTSFKVVE
ncbi:MAG: hypothetical protein JXR64_02800 [Spirochaetales bacterium]|nr:hypothetical protein [Spirochaetales bacterium]